MPRAFLFLLVAVAFLLPPLAARAAQVEGLQLPAWVERGGQKQPLRPGMTLGQADTIETGAGGRALVRLADGSLLKLGEQARVSLESLKESDMPGGTLTGILNVVQGAFRYTAGALARRDLEVRVATTTIGIRGTDVWGRSRDGGATVCLIEGRVEMQNPVRGNFVMDRPLSFFVAPRDGEPLPVAPVDPDKLKQWAAETELDRGHGVLLPDGGWLVQLGAEASEAAARRAERRLLAAGIPVERSRVQIKDRMLYRLRVAGFDSEQDAKAFAATMRGRYGVTQPWVTCETRGRSCE